MLWSIDPQDAVALHEQIAVNVRRAVTDGDLGPGERLPAAAELAAVLEVNANTVLHAYRRLREEGILEFRRGRGVRVGADAPTRAAIVDAARALLALGRAHGYGPGSLAELLAELA